MKDSQRGKIIVIGVGKSEYSRENRRYPQQHRATAGAELPKCTARNLGMAEGDTVLALSYSGQTPELLNLLPHLKRQAAAIIALTGKTSPRRKQRYRARR